MGRFDNWDFTRDPTAEELSFMIGWCRELIGRSALPQSLSPLLWEADTALSAGDLGAAHRLAVVLLTYDPRVQDRSDRRLNTFAGTEAESTSDEAGLDDLRPTPLSPTAALPNS